MKRLLALALIATAAFGQAITTNPNQVTVTTFYLYYNKMSYQGTWSAGQIYNAQDVVFYSGATYVSLQIENLANNPASSSLWWAAFPGGGGGGGVAWGGITGTLSAQTDLESALTARLLASNNLSDLPNKATARSNLSLGSAALLSVWGSGNGAVAANALGTSGNCMQWTGAGAGDAGSPCGVGSGGSNVSVNGTGFPAPNFNAAAPSVDSGYTAATFKASGANVIAEVPSLPAPGDYAVLAMNSGNTAITGSQYLTFNGDGNLSLIDAVPFASTHFDGAHSQAGIDGRMAIGSNTPGAMRYSMNSTPGYAYNTTAVSGATVIPSGGVDVEDQAGAFVLYNNSTVTGGVALSGFAAPMRNNAGAVWGLNTLTTDENYSTSTIYTGNYIFGDEVDVNFNSTSTSACGICVGGYPSAQAAGAYGVLGMQFALAGYGYSFGGGIVFQDGFTNPAISPYDAAIALYPSNVGGGTGTVNTSSTGNTVTWASGTPFYHSWAYGPTTIVLTIGGTPTNFTVATVSPPNILTLTTSPGNNSGIAYSVAGTAQGQIVQALNRDSASVQHIFDFYFDPLSNWTTTIDGTSHFKINPSGIVLPDLAAASGSYYVCINTSGQLTSSASAC